MKKITFLFLFFAAVGFSQTKGISYQALILDPIEQQLPGFNNYKAPLANKNICLQFSVIDENTDDEYVETHIITTDEFGMVASPGFPSGGPDTTRQTPPPGRSRGLPPGRLPATGGVKCTLTPTS